MSAENGVVTLDQLKDLVDSMEQSGQDSIQIIPMNNCGELEDLIIKTGSFENAGSGWNTFNFPYEFESIPIVICSVQDGYGINIKDITKNHFLYQVTIESSGSSGGTKTLYQRSSPTSSYPYVTAISTNQYTSAFSVQLAGGSSGGTSSTSDAVTVNWVAIASED